METKTEAKTEGVLDLDSSGDSGLLLISLSTCRLLLANKFGDDFEVF